MKTFATAAALAAALTFGGEAGASVVLDLNLTVNSNNTGTGTNYGTVLGTITFADATFASITGWNFVYTPANSSPIAAYTFTPGTSSSYSSLPQFYFAAPAPSFVPYIVFSSGSPVTSSNTIAFNSNNTLTNGASNLFVGGTLGVAAVPEPSSLLTGGALAGAAAGAGLWRRRRARVRRA